MTGKGTRPKNALRASHNTTFESLPADHSMASGLRRFTVSRKMKIDCASNSSRRSNLPSWCNAGADLNTALRVRLRLDFPRSDGADGGLTVQAHLAFDGSSNKWRGIR